MNLRSSFFAFVAAFLSLLASIAVPQGMMPVWGADGFSVTLCSPQLGTEKTIDRSDDDFETLRLIEQAKRIANGNIQQPENDGAAQGQPCAFSVISEGAAMLPGTADINTLQRGAVWISGRMLTLSVMHRRHLPPATGPPSIFATYLNV